MKQKTTQSDRQMLKLAKLDLSAFDALFRKYYVSVFNYFWYRLFHDTDTAEDLTQETFLKAMRHVARYEDRGHSYQTYLLRIAHNTLVSHLRRSSTLPLEDAGDPPEEVLYSAEDRDEAVRLWKAVQELPLHERDAVLLKYRRGYAVREIAYILGRTEDGVKSLLARARKRLKAHRSLGHIAQFRSRVIKKSSRDTKRRVVR